MSVEEVSDGAFYIDQSALDNPPAAPSEYIFVVPAIAHVGRGRIPDWNDAERTNLSRGEDAARAGIDAIQSAAKLLHQAIMDKKITVYLRSIEGGSLHPMFASDWIIDQIPETTIRSGIFVETHKFPMTFRKGRARGSLPIMSQHSIDCEFYAFVKRDQLAEVFPLGIIDNVGDVEGQHLAQVASARAVRECGVWLADLFKSDTPGLPTRKAAMEEAFRRWPDGTISRRQFLNCYQSLSKHRPWMRRRGPRPSAN